MFISVYILIECDAQSGTLVNQDKLLLGVKKTLDTL